MTARLKYSPPHSDEAEAALCGCVMLDPQILAGPLGKASPELFYSPYCAAFWRVAVAMHRDCIVINLVTISDRLKRLKMAAQVNWLQFLSELDSKTPAAANWPYFLAIVREKYALRMLAQVADDARNRVAAGQHDVRSLVEGFQAELDIVSRLTADKPDRKVIHMHSAEDITKVELPENLRLVGDNEIRKGYEGVTLIAGPGGSGKSLAVIALALAGARGMGYWMGRVVHRRFKTMIFQSENGMTRLKKEISEMKKLHPELPIDECIRISSPPEGGLAFHKAEFRAAVREAIRDFQPDLVVLDTWASVAVEDQAKEVVEIRSCLVGGDECPGLLIVAHTKKPRADVIHSGRELVNAISGSIALVNVARCVYILAPWTSDYTESRIYWACAKLNDGAMYPPSVWHRRFGTFFEEDEETNPNDWGKTDEPDSRKRVTPEILAEAMKGFPQGIAGKLLVEKVAKIAGCGASTVWRAIGEDGYARPFLSKVEGRYVMQEGQ